MELLDSNKPKKNGQDKIKTIMILLIVCVVLLVVLLVIKSALPEKKKKEKGANEGISVNGTEITAISENLLITSDGIDYVLIEEIMNLVGYKYYNGEYLKNNEDKTKCHIDDGTEVVCFEAGNKKYYKAIINSLVEYQYYELKNDIVTYNNKLYISVNDLKTTCGVIIEKDQKTGEYIITTKEYYTNNKNAKLKKEVNPKYISISTVYNNMKALAYDMMVIETSDGKYGVIDKATEETIIGAKYSSLIFDEPTQSFIAQNSEGDFGVIKLDATVAIDFKYDEMSIISYEKVLYKVKKNNKYGVINENAEIVVPIQYDNIGCYITSDTEEASEEDSVLIVKDIYNGNDVLVVCKNNQYGIVDLQTGKEISPTFVDRIYSKTTIEDETIYYVYFKQADASYTLEKYIEAATPTTVVNPN